MCGITGYYSFSQPVEKNSFEAFTDAIAHRGPDGYGYYYHPEFNIALGHRRLSIIDLSEAGKQPMHDLSERYTIIFNGEVYNYLELRKELQGKGISFKTFTDTEVILAAYMEYGEKCVDRFNGMWAFAILNNQTGELFASRDRFGIKPFYYYFDSERFIFSSETISFKCLDNINLSFDVPGIKQEVSTTTYLEGNNKTIYKEIQSLPAGHNLSLDKTFQLKIKQWWSTTNHKHIIPEKFNDQVTQFRELFFDSIKLRLRSDVNVGTALSGGVDSSAVYCSLNHIASNSGFDKAPSDFLKAYVATFPGTKNDETEFAKKIIGKFKNDYKFITLDEANLAKQIENNTIKTGVITGTPLLPVHNLYAGMKKDHTTVSLDGHGADEQLFGYTWLVLAAQHDAASKNDTTLNTELTDCYLNLFEPERRNIVKSHLRREDKTIKKLLKKILQRQEIRRDSWSGSSETIRRKSAEQLLYENFHLSTLPAILRNFDRASMQAAVEIRMPFMDYRLVSFLYSLPIESKIGKGYTKLILREAMKNIVPDEIRLRTYKLGINAPVYEWFNGTLKNWLRDIISSSFFQNSTFFNGKVIAKDVLTEIETGHLSAGTCNRLWPYISAYFILK